MKITFEQYVKKARRLLRKREIREIKSMEKDKLILLHYSLGRYLRNRLNLWYEDLNGEHPDDFSMRIIIKLYEL